MRFLWKALVTVFVGVIACNLLDGMGTGPLTRRTPTPRVAVDAKYSIQILTTPSSWLLAEYDRSLEIFERDERETRSVGTMALPPDKGGATRVMLYTYYGQGSHLCVLLRDRGGALRADLETRRGLRESFDSQDPDIRSSLRYLGTFDNRTWPRLFLPAAVLSEAESLASLEPGATRPSSAALR